MHGPLISRTQPCQLKTACGHETERFGRKNLAAKLHVESYLLCASENIGSLRSHLTAKYFRFATEKLCKVRDM